MARRTLKLSRPTDTKLEPAVSGVVDEPTTEPSGVDDGVAEVDYSATDSSDFVAPESAERTPDAEPTKRKRGRPAGSTTKSKRDSAKGNETPEDLADCIYSVHYMLAQMCNSELLELDEDEAKKIGTAVARVNKHYTLRGISPKQMAWLNLLTALGTVYGPRAVAFAKQSHANKNKEKVTVMPPTPTRESEPDKQPQTIDGQ